ncbi:MAG: S1C family serine protease [Planctomycetota bacterium]
MGRSLVVLGLALGLGSVLHSNDMAAPGSQPVLGSFESSLKDVTSRATAATVRVQVPNKKDQQCGVLISPSGHVITLSSGLSKGAEVSVLLADGQIKPGIVQATWPLQRLGLIKIDTTEAPWLALGDASQVQVGDQVLTLGNAFMSARGRATRCAANYGILSGTTTMADLPGVEVLLTDARINQGSEGGPLIDIAGRVVGINSKALQSAQTNTRIFVAIPLTGILDNLRSLVSASIPRNEATLWNLGIKLDTRTLGSGGVVIASIENEASRGGLMQGDLITHVDGQEIRDSDSFEDVLKTHLPFRLIPVTVYRHGHFLKRYLAPHKNMPSEAFLLSETYRQALSKAAPCVVKLYVNRKGRGAVLDRNLLPEQQAFQLGTGPFSATVYRRDGYLVTSSFNLAGEVLGVVAELSDGRRLPATILGSDLGRNISLLKVDASDLPEPVSVHKNQIQVGSSILALGATLAKTLPTADRGIVSALNRAAGKAVQIDANLTPHNFGGPTVDLEGRILGVNIPQATMGGDIFRQDTAGGEFSGSGIGFMVPLSDIDLVFDALKRGERLAPAFLGIRFDNEYVDMGAKVQMTIKEVGMLKSGVTREQVMGARSPQEVRTFFDMIPTASSKAGIMAGDVILEFNGEIVPSPNVLLNIIGGMNTGEKAIFKISRYGAQMTVEAVLGPRGQVFE